MKGKLTMAIMMMEPVTHSQGRRWEGSFLTEPTISNVLTIIWEYKMTKLNSELHLVSPHQQKEGQEHEDVHGG